MRMKYKSYFAISDIFDNMRNKYTRYFIYLYALLFALFIVEISSVLCNIKLLKELEKLHTFLFYVQISKNGF